ncbi:lipoxygenase homology domain-containing protein 1-like [Pleurodeles waltl]|uniref:lipoxygenase homology domain-containing protein 1-like n=1 Tax=Pleurodeles waltl TaxID=8319 RepID=UPI0037093856
MTLRGTFGDTGRRRLSLQGETFFQRGKVHICSFEAVDIGQLQELYLEKEKGSDWQPEKIVVKEGEFAEKKITFLFRSWVKDRKNKTSAATLHVEDVQEVINGEAFPPGGEQMQSEGEWNVYLTTQHMGGPRQSVDTKQSSCNFFMVFYGTRGTSSTIEMENSKQSQSLDQIKYTVHLPHDLGELYKVRLGLQNLPDQTAELFLQHFKMQNTSTFYTFSHSIKKTLPLSFNCDRCIEIPVEWPLKSSFSEVTYQVIIMSNRYVEKRNISQVSLCLFGANGDTGKRYISKLWPDEQKENSNQCFSVAVYAVELGELQKISLSVSNRNGYKLYVEKVHVKESTKQHTWIFDVNEEFSGDTHEDDLQREFLPSHGHNKGNVPLGDSITYPTSGRRSSKADTAEYLITVYTGDVMGAGTDAKVHIVLTGEHGSSGTVHLTESLEHKNPFERAKVDTFRITTKRLGGLFKLEIGHDGKGYGSGWFLEKVEITDFSDNEMHTFSCNRWLAEDEEDGQTVVQLLI